MLCLILLTYDTTLGQVYGFLLFSDNPSIISHQDLASSRLTQSLPFRPSVPHYLLHFLSLLLLSGVFTYNPPTPTDVPSWRLPIILCFLIILPSSVFHGPTLLHLLFSLRTITPR